MKMETAIGKTKKSPSRKCVATAPPRYAVERMAPRSAVRGKSTNTTKITSTMAMPNICSPLQPRSGIAPGAAPANAIPIPRQNGTHESSVNIQPRTTIHIGVREGCGGGCIGSTCIGESSVADLFSTRYCSFLRLDHRLHLRQSLLVHAADHFFHAHEEPERLGHRSEEHR